MRHPVALLVPVIAALCLAAAGRGAAEPLVPPYDLYEANAVPPGALADLAGTTDWRVVHQEQDRNGAWLLLALPDGSSGRELPGWGRPRYLGRVRDGERLVFMAPEVSGRERLRSGRPLTIAPSQGTVLVTRERTPTLAGRAVHAFQMLEHSLPVAGVPRAGAPEEFVPVLERARRQSLGRRTPAEVEAVIAQVRPDSLESYVRELSEKDGFPTNRYYAHPNTEVVHKDYIQRKFRDALGDANVSNHSFEIDAPSGGGTITINNVVGRLPSAVPGAGAFFLTAHYDAIGNRSDPAALCAAGLRDPTSGCDCSGSAASILSDPDCAWDWSTDPTPGADDNATGIATLIEAARLLSSLEFDFDLYFVAFQGEEQGLIGSAAFADSVAGAGQPVYGVLNVDMLGYNAVRNEADLVTNETSEWLADFIVETSELFVPDLPLEKHVVLFGRSDHASFWSQGIDAVLLFEDINLPYPGYHSFNDRWDTVFPPSGRPNSELQFQLAVQLAVGTVARWAVHYEAPDLALPAGELVVQPIGNSAIEVGDNVVLQARVHNYGTSSLSFNGSTTDTLTARVAFYDGDPDAGGTEIATSDRRAFFPGGGVVPISATWTIGEGEEGFHEIYAVVSGLDTGYPQSEPSDENNRASVELFVEAPFGSRPEVLTHYVYPNPVTGSRDDFNFYFELTRDAERVIVEIYDVEGTLMGFFRATSGFVGNGNQAGANVLTSNEFAWESDDLQSGIYLYTIRIFGSDGLAAVEEGKFGLVR